ncbi:hypothetical protein PM082_018441 [Marasmius tenuissimus]|nr:hypothetical protein PM082_018441 [Marasmius tenuissimus]
MEGKEITLKAPLLSAGKPQVICSDGKHLKKNGRGSTTSGARGLALGNYECNYALLARIAEGQNIPLLKTGYIEARRLLKVLGIDFLGTDTEGITEDLQKVLAAMTETSDVAEQFNSLDEVPVEMLLDKILLADGHDEENFKISLPVPYENDSQSLFTVETGTGTSSSSRCFRSSW